MKTNSLNYILASNIRSRRMILGISQELLSEMLDVHRNTISLLETGKRGISLELLAAIAKALNCQAYELLIPTKP